MVTSLNQPKRLTNEVQYKDVLDYILHATCYMLHADVQAWVGACVHAYLLTCLGYLIKPSIIYSIINGHTCFLPYVRAIAHLCAHAYVLVVFAS